ncbi:hypothetical protein ACFVR1_16745 [Psychrobacillus sp. NPDC058041]|uniref:hypothetical protein n=1 Tax=Psychrobacillus sp. NPDC058041 TaxID=3346310 RepID=UPI0036DD4A56
MYYIMLIAGALFVLFAIFLFIYMYVDKEFAFLNVAKTIGAFLIGVLLLVITLPSLKYMILKEYDVVSGDCSI